MIGHIGHDWSSEQQRLLGALGYTLYRPAGSMAGFGSDRDDRPRAAAPPSPNALPAAPAPRDSRLQANLRRAAGGELESLPLPPLESLRRDPAGKRALWPMLRRLRRERR